jgi:hypothetical protein
VQVPRELLPELGRCVPSARKLGEFRGAHCNYEAGGRGNHNWLPGPGARKKFTSVIKSPALETPKSGVLISCASGKAEGEYTGVKTLKVTKLTFSGCAQAPAKGEASDCQNIGSPAGQIETKELAGELGFIEVRPKAKVGVDLKAASGSQIAMFECGGAVAGKGTGTGTLRELEGSVIGRAGNLNNMVSANSAAYEAKSGHQIPERFQGGAKDTLVTLVGAGKTAEPTTLVGLEEVTNEEPLEIRAKICNTSNVCSS